jgi:hypothetical protein
VDTEQWLPVVSYGGIYQGLYEVSDWGRVQSLDRLVRPWRPYIKPGEILTPQPGGSDGSYLTVVLVGADGKKKHVCVHWLVLRSFAGECPEGMQGCHGPGGKLDNRWPENLYYGTLSQNNGSDKIRDGMTPADFLASLGEHGVIKLTEDMVREIRVRRAAGETCTALAAEFGVSIATVSHAAIGRTWSHVT